MLKFTKYSFIIIFFGSIFYLVYHMVSINDEYKKDVAILLKERRLKIEKECKYIEDLDLRLNCFLKSANNLRPKLRLPEALVHAKIMYTDTYQLTLSNKVLESESYKDSFSKLETELSKIYSFAE